MHPGDGFLQQLPNIQIEIITALTYKIKIKTDSVLHKQASLGEKKRSVPYFSRTYRSPFLMLLTRHNGAIWRILTYNEVMSQCVAMLFLGSRSYKKTGLRMKRVPLCFKREKHPILKSSGDRKCLLRSFFSINMEGMMYKIEIYKLS